MGNSHENKIQYVQQQSFWAPVQHIHNKNRDAAASRVTLTAEFAVGERHKMQNDRNLRSANQFRKMRSENCAPSQKVRSRKHFDNARNVRKGLSSVEGTAMRGDSA